MFFTVFTEKCRICQVYKKETAKRSPSYCRVRHLFGLSERSAKGMRDVTVCRAEVAVENGGNGRREP